MAISILPNSESSLVDRIRLGCGDGVVGDGDGPSLLFLLLDGIVTMGEGAGVAGVLRPNIRLHILRIPK